MAWAHIAHHLPWQLDSAGLGGMACTVRTASQAHSEQQKQHQLQMRQTVLHSYVYAVAQSRKRGNTNTLRMLTNVVAAHTAAAAGRTPTGSLCPSLLADSSSMPASTSSKAQAAILKQQRSAGQWRVCRPSGAHMVFAGTSSNCECSSAQLMLSRSVGCELSPCAPSTCSAAMLGDGFPAAARQPGGCESVSANVVRAGMANSTLHGMQCMRMRALGLRSSSAWDWRQRQCTVAAFCLAR
jgi:hypothetical protein